MFLFTSSTYTQANSLISPTLPHPFIQILSHSKGKKAIPRVFQHLDEHQRLTMLTILALKFDQLDVVRDAYPPADGSPLPAKVKEEVELFNLAVNPPIWAFVNEVPLDTVIGLLGLILDHCHVQGLVRTKIGVLFLTLFLSRAEIILSNTARDQQTPDVQHWSELYGRLFDTIEPVLPFIFPADNTTHLSAQDDVYVWQFLAAMGVGASPDQQQRLVLGVKDRVMETVQVSKSLPTELRERRLGDVNLFMKAIGLDVALLG
jgi:DNA topoisomerase 2-associated protein PAT1